MAGLPVGDQGLLEARALLLNAIFNAQAILDADETSSSEDEDDEKLLMNHYFRPRDNLQQAMRIEDYVEHLIPRYHADAFQSHFRLTIPAYEALEFEIRPQLMRQDNGLGSRSTIPVPKQLLSILWILSTQDSYRSVGDRFDMSKSTLSRCFVKVINALGEIAPHIITWPNQEDRQRYSEIFEQLSGIPNIIGAIDGTFVLIKAPQDDTEVYVTRKCNYAFTAQGICAPNLKFIDIFVGYPGSVSDTRIFTNSPIYGQVTMNRNNFFDPRQFIIGDKAYLVLAWCIPPYINHGNLTPANIRFNRIHAGQRAIIERAWALLFGRYRRLKYLDMNRTDWVPATVLACCVLHNICLNFNPVMLLNELENDSRLNVLNPKDQNNEHVEDNNEGKEYRDELCQALFARQI